MATMCHGRTVIIGHQNAGCGRFFCVVAAAVIDVKHWVGDRFASSPNAFLFA